MAFRTLEKTYNQISFGEGKAYLESMLRWHFKAYNKLIPALLMTGDYRSVLKICEEGREGYLSNPLLRHIIPSLTFYKDSEEYAIARQDEKRKKMKQQGMSREEAQVLPNNIVTPTRILNQLASHPCRTSATTPGSCKPSGPALSTINQEEHTTRHVRAIRPSLLVLQP